jgi:hypothetical protein
MYSEKNNYMTIKRKQYGQQETKWDFVQCIMLLCF